METGESLDLFETKYLNEFSKLYITSLVGFDDHVIVGDATGGITFYKMEKNKYKASKNSQPTKSKIDALICNNNSNFLVALTGEKIFVYDLENFINKSLKDSDKDYKDTKDIAKMTNNLSPDNADDILVISKKKKMLFFTYKSEIQRLVHDNYKDNDKKPLELSVKEIPEKIKWYGKYICYYLKSSNKIIFLTLDRKKIDKKNEVKSNEDVNKSGKPKEDEYYVVPKSSEQDLVAEDIIYIQNSWMVYTGGIGLFFSVEGQPITKNPVTFNPEGFVELEVFNDIYIVALYKNSIGIYSYNDGSMVQELTAETNNVSIGKFLSEVGKKIYMVNIEGQSEKAKPENCKSRLWQITELSLETQIKKMLQHNQLDKAFQVLNSKLDYNMEKFSILEKFYCDCAWNRFKQNNVEGYKEAEKYFCLCNFNPFELIYHFIEILKIVPIHSGFKEIDKLPEEVRQSQIKSKEGEKLNANSKAALELLVNCLRVKKNYIFTSNKIPINTSNNSVQKLSQKELETIKDKTISFDTSESAIIDLSKSEPYEMKLSAVIEIINLVLVKALILTNSKVEFLEEVIEYDIFNTDYLSDKKFFNDNKSFQSDMALAYICKRQEKYSDALKLLKPYIDDIGNSIANKQSRNLATKILEGFGKDKKYSEVFEEGLRYLLNHHQMPAFEILLSHELISIDDFLKRILPDFDKDNNDRREKFLRLLCEDKKYANYSNEKYHTLYVELFLDKLIVELNKEFPNLNLVNEKNLPAKFIEKYNDFKKILKEHNKFDKKRLLSKIQDSCPWMHEVEILLLTELKKFDDVLRKMLDLIKIGHREFEQLKDFCKKNYRYDIEIYQKYFKLLRESYDNKQNDPRNVGLKNSYKKEMLKLLSDFIYGALLEMEEKKSKSKLDMLNILKPKEILTLIPGDWKLNEVLDENHKDKTLYDVLRHYLKEYALINNNYKRLENLAKMNLTYKQKKLFELKDQHVSLDSNSTCFLCGKKIGNNTAFMVYPNGHIYHCKCSQDPTLEPKTGRNFSNFNY